jgi:hypothetical protein
MLSIKLVDMTGILNSPQNQYIRRQSNSMGHEIQQIGKESI